MGGRFGIAWRRSSATLSKRMVVFTKAHGARPSIRLRANPAKLSAIARTRSVRAGLLEGGSGEREEWRCRACCLFADSPIPGSRSRYGVGRGCGVGRGLGVALGGAVGLGSAVGVTVGVRVGVALGVGVGLGEHTLSTSTKRATVCWFPWSVVCTPVTRKPPSFLLVTTEPRAGNWTVPAKTFTASPSRSPSEDSSCTQTVLELKSVHLTR